MKSLITVLLVCLCCGLKAQPGPRHITLNINEYSPSEADRNRVYYGMIEYSFVIDSTSDFSRLANLYQFKSLKLVVKLKKLPVEIGLLSNSLKKLDIYSGQSLSNLSSLHYLKRLSDLTIYGFNQSTLPDLSGIVNLKSLTIFGGKIKDVMRLSSSKSLTKVTLYGTDSLREINLNAKNVIDTLSIEYVKNLKSIRGILNCRQLKQLFLYQCWELKDIGIVARSRSLRSLTIYELDRLEGLNFDMSKMNLDDLKIAGCESMQNISGIASCKTLKKLTLNYMSKFITALSFDMSRMNLQEMEISDCDGMRDISGIASCKTLKKLTLNSISKYIRTLNFDMSSMNLSDLKIAGDDYYWSPITDISGITSCHTLRSLELSNLDSLKVIDFKNKATDLQTLTIQDCKSLETIAGLLNCKALRVLVIKENPRLTKIPDVKSEIPFVKGIIIQGNHGLKIPDCFGDLTQGHEWDIFDNGKL